MMNASPLMVQYRDIKSRYQDCVLLFRVGDFYETFYEDAVDIARILNIALTTRDKNKPNPIPLAGVPFHAAESYITKLLAAGRRVAICEQVEDAAQAKGLVKRDVVEVLTPGTAINTQLLDERENNYCLAVTEDGVHAGVALLDVSTGELLHGEGRVQELQPLLQGKRIREIYHGPEVSTATLTSLRSVLGDPFVVRLNPQHLDEDARSGAFARQFAGGAPAVLVNESLARNATASLLAHCHDIKDGPLPQVIDAHALDEQAFLAMDDETIRNLELFEPLYGGDRSATLIRMIDRTHTSMGAREIRSWLEKPLANADRIDERLESVSELYNDAARHEEIGTMLRKIQDMERLTTRIATRKAIPRELHSLRESLECLPALRAALGQCDAALLRRMEQAIEDHSDLAVTIARAVVDDPPGHLREGGVIRHGYSDDLDELIDANEAAKRWIADLERRERERSGISNLKVGFNRVFGYFIEVSKAHLAKVPDDYIAKQTLVNSERYYTPTLKEKEQIILESEERRARREQQAFDDLCGVVESAMPSIQNTAHAVAQVDVLQSLAWVAREKGFKRPIVDDSLHLELVKSRHPVVEQLVKEAFVPNDLSLDLERRQFALITGPNMSGKSTFLRQVAVVVVLAQMGSFVPAERARVGLVDQIFTRVGASDRLSRGESTFLVEMKETAYILDHITDRSLVLLDEVGRGTSTYDGLSIAWAVTEYLLQGIKARPKTLFATHFHELTQLHSSFPRLLNLKIAIREWEGGVIFLRKIVPGTSDRSYGIHAARVAGVPAQVLARANEILQSLEQRRDLLRQGVSLETTAQMGLFAPAPSEPPSSADPASAEIAASIDEFDVDNSTPMQALDFVQRLKKRLSD